MSRPSTLSQLFALDSLLDADEIAIRDTVRDYANSRLRPHIADWFEDAKLPAREIAKELGQIGALGMHLEGYGCPGTSATAYGLACLELEAVDSGIRSLVSVQGSLAMFSIHHWGFRGPEERVAAAHGRRRGDRLLRPDRTRLRLQPVRHAHQRQA